MSTTDDTKRRKAATKRGSNRSVTHIESATSAGESDGQRPADAGDPPMSAYPPPPEALRRRGLLRVETNKAPGQELELPDNRLAEAFGEIAYERLMAKKQAALDEQENPPCTD